MIGIPKLPDVGSVVVLRKDDGWMFDYARCIDICPACKSEFPHTTLHAGMRVDYPYVRVCSCGFGAGVAVQQSRMRVRLNRSQSCRFVFPMNDFRNDHMELGNHADFLGVMRSAEMLTRWFVNDSMSHGTYRLKGHAEAVEHLRLMDAECRARLL